MVSSSSSRLGSGSPRRGIPYVDVHCHAVEYSAEDWEKIEKLGILVVAVSEDLQSSHATIELAKQMENVTPCVGIHPWCVGEASLDDLKVIEKMISREEARCIGEVGLDKKFVPETIERQRVFFEEFLRIAREYDVALNLHTAGAWREVYEELLRNDIRKAVFHWYTGPLDLMESIVENGYLISINVAAKIQEKHREVIKRVPLSSMVTESDGPYKYRGLRLSSAMLPELVKMIAEIKGVSENVVLEKAYTNHVRLLWG